MFDFLKPKSPELTLTLDRPDGVYYPGDVIGLTIDVLPAKDLKVRAGRVRLTGTEHFQFSTVTYTTDSNGNSQENVSHEWAKHELFAEGGDFLGETTLVSGTPERFTFQTQLPADALPSFRGEILRVVWQVEAKLDRRLAADLEAETELRVPLRAPGPAAQPGEYGESSEPDEAELALLLPGLEALAGETLSGQLRIRPQTDFSAEVRVELVRGEHVPFSRGNHSEKDITVKLAGSTRFQAGQEQSFPFEVALPPEAPPSLQTAHGTINWRIKGILARRLRRDTSVAQGITVFTARAGGSG